MLLNGGMKNQIESGFVNKMEKRIKKNNLYVEIAYKEISAANVTQKNIIMLQPSFSGIGINLYELWNQFFKKP